MKPTGGSVDEFVAAVTPEVRRRDALVLIDVLRELTGLEPELWGTIIGFGECHYRYPSGTEGDMPRAGFSPRKGAMTVYTTGADYSANERASLGPHTVGKSCIYIKDFAKIDLDVLRGILADDLDRVARGHDGGELGHVTVTR